jgi:hypothetical protein
MADCILDSPPNVGIAAAVSKTRKQMINMVHLGEYCDGSELRDLI